MMLSRQLVIFFFAILAVVNAQTSAPVAAPTSTAAPVLVPTAPVPAPTKPKNPNASPVASMPQGMKGWFMIRMNKPKPNKPTK